MTELSGNAVFLDPETHRRGLAGEEHLLRAAGRPAPGVEVRVADADDHTLPTGEVGEILVRAPQVMAGYLDDPAATAAALRGGWLHTGDVGRFDDEGLLYVVDRSKDIIITGGENVSSREVEDVLLTAPGVSRVAVVGVPDPTWGENVCAVVVPTADGSFDPDAARRHRPRPAGRVQGAPARGRRRGPPGERRRQGREGRAAGLAGRRPRSPRPPSLTAATRVADQRRFTGASRVRHARRSARSVPSPPCPRPPPTERVSTPAPSASWPIPTPSTTSCARPGASSRTPSAGRPSPTPPATPPSATRR